MKLLIFFFPVVFHFLSFTKSDSEGKEYELGREAPSRNRNWGEDKDSYKNDN